MLAQIADLRFCALICLRRYVVHRLTPYLKNQKID